MRPELETYHLIDSYLNGKLEGEALRSFEHQLQSDPAFAEEVSFQQLTNEVVTGASYNDLRAQMTKDIDKIDALDTTKRWSLYTAAVFILITGTVSLYYYTKTSAAKQTDTKKSIPAVQSPVSSSQSGDTYSTEDSKTSSSQNNVHSTIPEVKNSVPNKIDTQVAVVPAPQPQQHTTPVQQTTPDVKIVQPFEQVVKTPKESPCNINAHISVSASCLNESTGTIGVGGLTGGAAPIHVTIPELSASARNGGFTYLKAGMYTVRIEDAKGCVKLYSAEVTEKSCKKTSYVFAPDNGETWKISGAGDINYTITLINIAGTQVYKSVLMQGEFEWQGIGQQGEYLSAGLYIYVIEYTNGQKENGQVTIVR